MKRSVQNYLLTLTLFVACTLPTHAASYFSDNRSIDHVVNPGRVQQQGDVEILEFFWYGCPHCANFEPALTAWFNTLPNNVKFVRLPASWSADMRNQQRFYFTLEALNRLDLHSKVFNDIHRRHISLTTPVQFERWVQAQGINIQAWQNAYNSTAVLEKVAYAQAAYKRFELNWVPAIIVNGKHVVAFTPNILVDTENLVNEELAISGKSPL